MSVVADCAYMKSWCSLSAELIYGPNYEKLLCLKGLRRLQSSSILMTIVSVAGKNVARFRRRESRGSGLNVIFQ